MAVGVDHHKQHRYEFIYKSLIGFVKQFREMLARKLSDKLAHLSAFLLLEPRLLERLKLRLVELTKQSKASSLVKEVKFLVILVLLGVFFGWQLPFLRRFFHLGYVFVRYLLFHKSHTLSP